MAKARFAIWRFSRNEIITAAKYYGVKTECAKGLIYDHWYCYHDNDASMIRFLDKIYPNWRSELVHNPTTNA